MKLVRDATLFQNHSFSLTPGVFQAPEKQPTAVEEDENASSAQPSTETSNVENIFSPSVFVNTRRGKRIGCKRKISDTAMVNECDVHGPGAADVRYTFLFHPSSICFKQ